MIAHTVYAGFHFTFNRFGLSQERVDSIRTVLYEFAMMDIVSLEDTLKVASPKMENEVKLLRCV